MLWSSMMTQGKFQVQIVSGSGHVIEVSIIEVSNWWLESAIAIHVIHIATTRACIRIP